MNQSAAAAIGVTNANANNDANNDDVVSSSLSSDNNNSYSYLYESAVKALLSPGLHQSITKEDILKSSLRRTKTVSDMRYYWNKILKYNNHDDQKKKKNKKKPLLIHITGTKGKGSTACMCETILRSNGYKTGLFTSPHLINIRERIRYNGQPINEKLFNEVYWKIRHALEYDESDESESSDGEVESDDLPPKLPGYFRMLTLMGMYTFLYELADNVDVIILEVGMGGRYDATNFLDTTNTTTTTNTAATTNSNNYCSYFQRVVYGVTLLDLDHTRILGTTLKQIAWEKGGIFSMNKLNPNGISSTSTSSTTSTSKLLSEPKSNSKSTTTEKEETDDKDKPSSSTSSSSSNKKYYILDSNTSEVINMMKSCARVEGGGGNGNGNENENEELVLVDSNGIELKDALLSSPSLALGLAGNHQYGNATLALELCQAVTSSSSSSSSTRNNYGDDDDDDDDDVINKRRRIANNKIELNSSMTLNALSNATWPGRCQTLMWSSSSSSLPFDDDHNRSSKKKNIRFYLDGAHTPQSLDATVEWFRSKSNSSSSSNGTGSGETDGGGSGSGGGDEKPQSSPPLLPILVFNCSHERNPVELLELLLKHQSGFSRVYFAQSDTSRPSPIAKASAESLLKERGITIREELLSDEGKKTDDDSEGEIEGKMNTKTTTTTWQETLAIIWKHLLIESTADTKSASASALVSSSQTRDKDSSSIIRCNMTANEIVQEISLLVQQQQQKHRGDNDNDDDNDDSKTTLPLQKVFVTGSLYLVGSFLTTLGWTEESSPTSPSPASSSSTFSINHNTIVPS